MIVTMSPKTNMKLKNILMASAAKIKDDPTLHKHETDAFYIRSGDEMGTYSNQITPLLLRPMLAQDVTLNRSG